MGKVIYKNLVRTSDNDDICFVLDQHIQLDFNGATVKSILCDLPRGQWNMVT